ncbi:rhomboid family intramembrane serine protease [Candidatus Woesearchaeota archaeon]|nr:rhomboid family intramembrane serine protease [Candidatus Woesearchaeota archaeon]
MKKLSKKQRLNLLIKRLSYQNLLKDSKKIVGNITFMDIILLLILPLIITLLMLLPDAIRTAMQIHIKEPMWWQLFTASYMHGSWKHLTDNLTGYFWFVIPIFIFAAYSNLKQLYYKMYLTICISLPIISGFAELWITPKYFPNLLTSTGTSGVISAFLGIIIFIWIRHYAIKSNNNLHNNLFFYLILFYVALIFSCIYSFKSIILILPLASLFLLFVFLWRKNFNILYFIIQKESKRNMLILFLSLFIPLFFMVAPFLLFPTINNVASNGTLVNFFMHYFGLIYGVIIGWLFVMIDKSTFRRKQTENNS